MTANASVHATVISNRISSAVAWTAGGSFASSGLTFVAMLLVARQLGPIGYGELTILQSSIGMLVVVAGLGLSLATTKYVSELRDRDSARAGRMIGLSVLASFLAGGLASGSLLVCAPVVANSILLAPHLTAILRINCILLWIGTLDGVQLGILAGLEAFRELALLKILRGLILFPAIIAGAYLGGVDGAVWGFVVVAVTGLLANTVALFWRLRDAGIPIRFNDCLREWRIVPEFGIPALLSTAFFSAGQWAAETVLIRQPNGYAELGIFQAASRLFVMLQVASSVLNRPLLPVLSQQWSADERESAAGIVGAAMGVNARFIGVLALVGCLAGPYVMLLFGPGYAVAWPTLAIVLCCSIVAATFSPIGHWIMASSRAWTNAVQYGVWAVTFFVSTVFLASWGSLGIATAQFVAYAVYGILAVRSAAMQLRWSELSSEFQRNLLSTKFTVHTECETFKHD